MILMYFVVFVFGCVEICKLLMILIVREMLVFFCLSFIKSYVICVYVVIGWIRVERWKFIIEFLFVVNMCFIGGVVDSYLRLVFIVWW